MDINFNKRQRRLIKTVLRPYQKRARVDLYKVFTALAYLIYTGCQWKMLPSYFPRPGTVYYHFRKWSEIGRPIKILKHFVKIRRQGIGRKAEPAVAVVDSQSIRSACCQSQKGVDGFKKVKGVKRQILVDSQGYPLLVEITRANVHDSNALGNMLTEMRLNYPSIGLLKADLGYRGLEKNDDNLVVECVKSNFGTTEFKPVSGRWVVERTHSWLENYRRMCRNYERYLFSALSMTYIPDFIIGTPKLEAGREQHLKHLLLITSQKSF